MKARRRRKQSPAYSQNAGPFLSPGPIASLGPQTVAHTQLIKSDQEENRFSQNPGADGENPGIFAPPSS